MNQQLFTTQHVSITDLKEGDFYCRAGINDAAVGTVVYRRTGTSNEYMQHEMVHKLVYNVELLKSLVLEPKTV